MKRNHDKGVVTLAIFKRIIFKPKSKRYYRYFNSGSSLLQTIFVD
ncbi:protein of unknown function [[Clostridium] ultunense Esp]|uniref:Uncharacterized protein n=1 Tax=[Clostridium] ultunense Esp TaxID=1288971 RepID=A0A1M4PJ73_9FIRM|nr:protein of unknown function [[Clostridium] ultunense Esp]